jgi:hypothetical protein
MKKAAAVLVAAIAGVLLFLGCSSASSSSPSGSALANDQARCAPRIFSTTEIFEGELVAACGGYCCEPEPGDAGTPSNTCTRLTPDASCN